jgi:catechol 2,3-dioxygenase-like lactoylglutathione lyase family enzyme
VAVETAEPGEAVKPAEATETEAAAQAAETAEAAPEAAETAEAPPEAAEAPAPSPSPEAAGAEAVAPSEEAEAEVPAAEVAEREEGAQKEEREFAILGLHHAFYEVSDILSASSFYEEVLGLEVEGSKGGDVVWFTAGESRFALRAVPEAPRGGVLALEVDDLEKARQYLREKGRMPEDIVTTPEGDRYFLVLDKDRNKVAIWQRAPQPSGGEGSGSSADVSAESGTTSSDAAPTDKAQGEASAAEAEPGSGGGDGDA